MSAYLILDIDVHDPVAYEAYKRDVPRVVRWTGSTPEPALIRP